MSFIRYDNPRLPEMSRLASLRNLQCVRLSREQDAVQLYKVSSHSRPGAWRIVELHDEEAKCSCPSVEACTHIAVALSDYRPHFISEWGGALRVDLRDELLEMRQGTYRAGARKLIADYRARRQAIVGSRVELVETPF